MINFSKALLLKRKPADIIAHKVAIVE